MKKSKKPILMFIILILGLQLTVNTPVYANTQVPANLSYQPLKQSREELYQDIFISLLLPYIQKEVDTYYSKYLTDTPMVAPYTVYVLSAERPNGYRSIVFNIKLKVNSYIGPHLGVGLDYITVIVGGTGDIEIKKFEHIKSYELPPNYQNIIKKGYKNPIP
ncbi:DUF3888 domain-containing protein [Clostridium estertheticum]|uniref:DUF3888 domain-containing protein n=1 Tax=Clostridium estertheticum TaxID=238834 RepID=UPI001CF28843|nr:DUF3888 domain-containing protein [Clostridium estertheticum]MCB2357095.1 DUF3888 domain-containing protein [Clostridium estertheticum]WAG43778.1 DUF3888 domain-containing protein [Clostridium estertheticum]